MLERNPVLQEGQIDSGSNVVIQAGQGNETSRSNINYQTEKKSMTPAGEAGRQTKDPNKW